MQKSRSRKYRKVMHVEESTQITHHFAEVVSKFFLLFVNVKQKNYDSSSKQVKKNCVFCFQLFVFLVKINLCYHVHFKKNVSLKLKNRKRISGFFAQVFLLRNTGSFANPGKYKKPVS
jgi:uncharacterized protein YggL (DUF469 family)